MDFALTDAQADIRRQVGALARTFSWEYWREKDREHEYPEEFVDEYQKELRTLIDAKIEAGEGFDVSETFGDEGKAEKGGEVIDLMEALRASVERTKAARTGGGKAAAKDADVADGEVDEKKSTSKPKKTTAKKKAG